VPGAPHAGAWRTKRRIFTTNYEPKSPVRHASDRSDEKTVIVRGALMRAQVVIVDPKNNGLSM
jgi:hypothetical protein